MKYRRNFFYILTPLVQILFYFILYEGTNYLAHRMRFVYSKGVIWGISAQVYALKYIIIVVVLAILIFFFTKRTLLLCLIFSIIFTILVLPSLANYPYRGGLVILIGDTGIFISYLLLLKYRM